MSEGDFSRNLFIRVMIICYLEKEESNDVVIIYIYPTLFYVLIFHWNFLGRKISPSLIFQYKEKQKSAIRKRFD